jgi:bacterioferritin (cytochrome b1)
MNSKAIIHRLNELLEAELLALEYYRIHADAIQEEEIVAGINAIIPAEHAHAVSLSTRILEMGGIPVQPGGKASAEGREKGEASKGQGTPGMLKLELDGEKNAIKAYAEMVADLEGDLITLDMLEEQLFDEMRHAKWLKQMMLKVQP